MGAKAKEMGINLEKREIDILISETGSDPFAILNKLERLCLEAKPPLGGLASSKSDREPNYFNFADAVFVQKKTFQDLRNFSSWELKKISRELLDLFSSVRRGEDNFEEGLEKLIIRLLFFLRVWISFSKPFFP